MARLVHLSVVPHDPTLAVAAAGRIADVSASTRRLLDGIAQMRRNLAEARPDCIVMVGSDHLCAFFTNNMPPFLIGKASRMAGPPAYERSAWGLDAYDVPVERSLACHLLTDGFERDVDFAYSDEFVADHAFTIPLNFMRPEADLPVVPISLNYLAPPMPPARRYHKVGDVVRASIESWDRDTRVAVIATGHMTNGVGGPYMLQHVEQPETEWDRTTHQLLLKNDIAGVLSHAAWEKMYAQGNNTPGFLGYVFALGVAGGAPPSTYDYVPSTSQPVLSLLEWTEQQLNGEPR